MLSALFLQPVQAAWVNAHETEETSQLEIVGVISVIQPNYVTIVYNDAVEGINQEIGFPRNPDVSIKYRSGWGDIKAGEEVIFKFDEVRVKREGRNEKGEFKQESFVKERRLIYLEFAKPNDKPLVSG